MSGKKIQININNKLTYKYSCKKNNNKVNKHIKKSSKKNNHNLPKQKLKMYLKGDSPLLKIL